MVIDLTRSGYDCPDGYYENVVDYVNEKINDINIIANQNEIAAGTMAH